MGRGIGRFASALRKRRGGDRLSDASLQSRSDFGGEAALAASTQDQKRRRSLVGSLKSKRTFWLRGASSDTLCAMPRGWCFVLTLLLPTAISGQALVNLPHADGPAPGFVLESWTVKDGLPVNSINKVIQSKSGYIWLATFDGLVRFDGVRFTTFNIGNSDGLPTSRIIAVVEESHGSLLLTTEFNQLVRFR